MMMVTLHATLLKRELTGNAAGVLGGLALLCL
jgi:hypothetical protein